ncbi:MULTISPECIES: DUF3349 domain-containing protein [Kocuria]|uniref:DUF3349 domain-containing protein n=1 Tax=Kocuria TaxID=57493 RepID=UPI000660EC89|nr:MULTISPECIES: DUF3349 domain-containing protein [Kocuria]MCT1367758.1 DUF3349 domain-containing protein [Rothia sp. p3-SID1597]RUQ20307.1 DUF3349 domain-containing protein [Kocuria sp. HSID16901]
MRNIAASVLRWLRAGYPNGMPSQDYIPLVAVLRRRLGDDEVVDICRQLKAEGVIPAETVDIGVEITKVTDEMPLPEDVVRVEERLRHGGWDL